MEKKIYSLSRITLNLFFLFLLSSQVSNSQCTNPTPNGDPLQTFCKSINPTVGSLVAAGGSTVVWFNALTGGTKYSNSSPLFNGAAYYADIIDGGGCSTSRLEVVVVINGNAPSNVNVFVGKCAYGNSTIADLSATGTNIEWYTQQVGGTLLDPTHVLENEVTYWVQQTEFGCTSTRLSTKVSLIDPPAPVVEAVQSFCFPPDPTVSDLQPSGSSVIWYEDEFAITPIDLGTPLIDGQEYWASTFTFPCESTVRVKTTVVLDAAPNAGTDGSYTECEINLVDTNLFSLLGGSPDSTGIWTAPDGSSHSGMFTAGTDVEGIYTYTVASALGVCPNAIASVNVMILIPQPPTTTEVNQTFCEIENATIADLNALGNGLLWYDTESSTTPLTTTDLLADGDYWASQTEGSSGCESKIRLVINVTIIKPVPPTTTEVNQSFCEIDANTVADLNATGNGVLWYDSEFSTTTLTSTDLLVDGVYWAAQTDASSGCASATRLAINVTIIRPTPPSTSEVNQSFCEIDMNTVSDLNVLGNGVIWYDTELSTTPLASTDLLADGDYWASQTDGSSGCASASRLVINVTIIKPTPPTTTEVNQSFCEIDESTVADLNAIGTGILWYDTETSTTPLVTTDLLADGDYWASQTEVASGCESATRLVVNVTILKPQPPTTTNANQAFCEEDAKTVADLVVTGNGVLWYDTETSTIPLATSDLLANGDYWAAQTDASSGCASASRLVVNVSLIIPLPPTTTEMNQSFCEIDLKTVADLNVTGTGILWYDTEFSSTPLASSDLLTDGDYWASQTETSIGCESPMRLMVTVSILKPVPPTTTEINQTFCEIDAKTVADLNVTGTGVLWYDTETSTTPLATSDLLADGDYWAAQTDDSSSCASASRLVINVIITKPPPPTTTESSQSFCIKDYLPNSPTIADLNVSGSSINWYASETSTTPLATTDILADGNYWASQTDASGCESATRLVVSVSVINPTPPTTSQSNQSFCKADNPTLSNLQIDGTAIVWYNLETSTTPLNSTTMLTDGGVYWAASSNAATGCESISRISITVTINDILPVTVSAISQSFCASGIPNVGNLSASGNNIVWFASNTDATPLNTSDLLIDGEDYWAAQTNTSTGCASSIRVKVNVILTDPGTPIIILYGNEFCKINKPTIADLNANVTDLNGGVITWYDAFPNGSVVNSTELLAEGETYYAIESKDGCTSIIPLAVTVTLESCDDYDIVIYDGFSPTGNGVNDTFKIGNLRDLYPNFKVEYYNRWGNIIYTSSASKPDWNGRLNGDGELVPAGVYYFVVYFNKRDRKPIQRRLYLSR